MIRSEILHAKTTQASAEHQREVSSLGRIQDREFRSRDDVKRREQSFWREIARASTAKPDARTGIPQTARGVPLERALEAHRLFQDAKSNHQGVTQELRTQISKVMRTKLAVDAFQKMQRKDRARCEYRRAERLGEQIEEAMTARLARHPSRGALTAAGEVREASEPFVSEELERVGGVPVPTGWTENTPPTEVRSTKSAEASARVTDAVSLQSLHVNAHESSPNLTVNIEHAGVPVACRLAATPSGEVGVVVGTSHATLSERLERGRLGIVAKLSELGIKVATLEVRRDSGFGSSSGAALRRGRRTQEERDENTIA